MRHVEVVPAFSAPSTKAKCVISKSLLLGSDCFENTVGELTVRMIFWVTFPGFASFSSSSRFYTCMF